MEKKSFSISARLRSFKYAFRGIWLLCKNEHNAWVEIFIGVTVSTAGMYFSISATEWILLVLCITIVIAAEGANSAIEKTIDIASPQKQEQARDAKDLAAGFVLITVIGTVIVGLIIFIPKIASLW